MSAELIHRSRRGELPSAQQQLVVAVMIDSPALEWGAHTDRVEIKDVADAMGHPSGVTVDAR